MKNYIFLFYFLAYTHSLHAQLPTIGNKVTEIKLPDINGKKIKLTSIKAKFILIDFWASWCGPCRKSIRDLQKLYQKYHSLGLEIYGISLDTRAYLKSSFLII